MRETMRSTSSAKHDPRVQALVKENLRLSTLLQAKPKQQAPAGARVKTLIEENKRLTALLQGQKNNVVVTSDVNSSKLVELEKENAELRQTLSKVASSQQGEN